MIAGRHTDVAKGNGLQATRETTELRQDESGIFVVYPYLKVVITPAVLIAD